MGSHLIPATYWPWLVLFALGAYHGLNPAMGWLFAVSLGLQEKSGGAVWRALPISGSIARLQQCDLLNS